MSAESPQRVAFETPRGAVTTGQVVDRWLEASTRTGPTEIVRIETPSGTYRVRGTEIEAVGE